MKKVHNYFVLKDYLWLLGGVLLAVFLLINQNREPAAAFRSWSLVLFDAILPDFFNPLKVEQLKNENIYLKTALLKTNQLHNEFYDLQQENRHLRAMVALPEREKYHYTYARVLARNPEKYPFTLLINIGWKDGIAVDDIAVSYNGLIGLVTECSKDFARISMICSPKNRIAVRTEKERVPGILNPVDEQFAEIKEITKTQKVEQHEKIFTSSYSTIYPDGLLIGDLRTVSDSSATIHKHLIVQYAVNFAVVEDLFVIKRAKTVVK